MRSTRHSLETRWRSRELIRGLFRRRNSEFQSKHVRLQKWKSFLLEQYLVITFKYDTQTSFPCSIAGFLFITKAVTQNTCFSLTNNARWKPCEINHVQSCFQRQLTRIGQCYLPNNHYLLKTSTSSFLTITISCCWAIFHSVIRSLVETKKKTGGACKECNLKCIIW